MTRFSDIVHAQRRRFILELLAGAPSYESSQFTLYHALDGTHVAASADDIGRELDWLAQRQLVALQTVGDDVKLVRITQRGVDCEKGLILVEGVARPDPGA